MSEDKKVLFTTIVIIGCGGIGSQLLPPLARYLASLPEEETPTLMLVDGDKYEPGNINRQEFPSQLSGENKAEAMAMLYESKYSGDIKTDVAPFFLGEGNVADVIKDKSIVLSCVDNHTCRRIVSKHCQTLEDCVLVSGGNSAELDGNVQIYRRLGGKSIDITIEERHPEIETTDDGDRSAMSCEELALIPGGQQVIFANLYAATIMNLIAHNMMNNPAGLNGCHEIYFDGFFCKSKRVINGVPE